MAKRQLGITVIVFCLATLFGCTGMQDKIRSMDRMRAIKKVKRGEIAGNTYINHFYKFKMVFNASFTPRLNDNDALLALHHSDQISEVRVFVREPDDFELNLDELVQVYGNIVASDTGAYERISSSDLLVNGLTGEEILIRYSLQGQPMNTLLHRLRSDHYDYVITFSTLEPLYEDLIDQITEIVGSFTVTTADDRDAAAGEAESPGGQSGEEPPSGSDTAETRVGGSGRQDAPDPMSGGITSSAGPDDSPSVGHVVQPGETLALIAEHYTGSYRNWRRIAEFNRIDDPALLQAGQEIRIPQNLVSGSPPPRESRSAGTREPAARVETSAPREVPLQQERDSVPVAATPPVAAPVNAKKTEWKKYALDADPIWQAISSVVGEQGYPVRISDASKHLLMTSYIYEGEVRYRFTVSLESITDNLTKLTIIGAMQKKSADDSWDDPADVGGRALWAKENQLYDRIEKKLQ